MKPISNIPTFNTCGAHASLILGLAAFSFLTVPQANAAVLLAHYKFDETSGATAVDQTGNNNATIVGGVTLAQTGIAGNAFLFDGTSGKVERVNAATFDQAAYTTIRLNGALTYSYWLNSNTDTAFSPTGRDSIVGFGDRDSTTRYTDSGFGRLTGTGAGPLTVYGRTRDAANIELVGADNNIYNGAWRHVAFTVSGTTFSLYVDGVLSGTPSTLTPDFLDNGEAEIFRIGALARSSNGDFFTGLLDDVQIYGSALTGSNVTFLFNNPGTAIPEPSAALLGGLGLLALLRRRRA